MSMMRWSMISLDPTGALEGKPGPEHQHQIEACEAPCRPSSPPATTMSTVRGTTGFVRFIILY